MTIDATKLRKPLVHPGEILRHEFLEPMGISQYRLAADIGVPSIRVSEVVRGKRGVTADTALRLAAYFDTTPEFWLNMQTSYDLAKAQRTFTGKIKRAVSVRR